MLTRFRHYTFALLVLVACATGYHALVSPFLEAPVVEPVDVGADEVLEIEGAIQDLFAEGAWQRGKCKQLQTADGMLLFQSWEQVENDQWRLWPVTVIVGRGMSADEMGNPIILEAEQGAEIKFTESLDVMSGGAPPIQRGRMIGTVHLHRVSEEPTVDSFEILTSNVGIDSQKIWTTETIEMTLGSTRLKGRDLTIHLDGPTQPSESREGAATVLDRMELIYLDELVMPLSNGSLWSGLVKGEPESEEALAESGGDSAEDALTQDEGIGMLSLTCGGRVEYDFALDHLSLRDSVSLVHHVQGKLADRFDCEAIRLVLNDPMNGGLRRESPLDWLVEIVATGDPVVAKLPAFEAELAAEKIDLNVSSGVIEASGSKGVQLRKGMVTARLARLNYRFDPKSLDVIGVIDAPGAGIVQFDDPQIPVRRAQWREGVKVRPKKVVDQPGSVASSASGLASPAEDGVRGEIMANSSAGANSADSPAGPEMMEQIEFWVDGDVFASMSDGGDFRADSIAGVLTNSVYSKGRVQYVPNRFEVSGGVTINTQALEAEAEKVLLFFVEEAVSLDPSNEGANGDSSLRQWVVQPKQSTSSVDPVARARPSIRGESIRAQLAIRGSEIEAKKLSVMGNVEVKHEIKTGAQLLPTRLTGDHLQLIDGGGEDVLQLTSRDGLPARLELGDGYFVGPQIQVRPSDNLIWMNAAGEFQLPTAALPLGGSEAGSAGYRWGKTPYCRWAGEMIFDGRTAVLSDGVEMSATLIRGDEVWELELSGDRLQAELAGSVSVDDMKAMRKAEVNTITLMQSETLPVIVQAIHRGLDGVMEARHLLNAKMLTLQPQQGGLLSGDGPGWYRGWVAEKADQPLLTRNVNASEKIDLNQRAITGAHLVFYGEMQAAFDGKQLEFTRGVRIGVKPTENWESTFDARKMDAISSGESTLDCDRLRFNLEPEMVQASQIAGLSSRWEMSAFDGVIFRTRNDQGLLEGSASRATYSSAKDLFTVEGAPKTPAIFRQTLPDGSAGPEGAVRSMTIRPGTMKVENAIIERLNIATPGIGGNR